MSPSALPRVTGSLRAAMFAGALAGALGMAVLPGALAAESVRSGGEGEGLAADSVVLRGVVRAEGLRADSSLPGALVEVRQDGRVRTGVSDARGRYRVEGLAAGAARVQVFHLATRPMQVEVRLPGSGELELDLEMERRTLALAGIEVSGSRSLGKPAPVRLARVPVGLATGGARTLEASTGMVEAGLVRALAPLAGEEDAAPGRVLFMRGSTVDARTVLLDGAPVLTPFHVAGLVSPFEPDLVGRASFYLGAAPSRYTGSLSYLLDVETRDPGTEGVAGRVAVDGLLWNASLESDIPGGGGILFARRSMHGLQGTLGAQDHFPYGYEDLLVRGSLPLAGDHRLRVTGFHNEEGVRLDEVLLAGGRARWGNRAGSLRYDGGVGAVDVSAVAAASRYDSSLPLAWSDAVLARASSLRERAVVDLSLPMDGWRLHLGASADRMQYGYQLTSRELRSHEIVAWDPVELRMVSGGGYAEAEASLGSRVDLRGGVRLDRFSGTSGVRFGPRASIRTFLTDEASLTVSAGRYHQPVPMPGLGARAVDEESTALEWNPSLPVASSSHLVLSLDQELDDHLHVDVSGFVKMFEGLEGVDQGRVRSSGTDLRVAYLGGRLDAWVGYALSWFWEERVGGSTTFSGRHLVSAGTRGTFYEGFEVGVTLGYGAGLPFASVPLASPTSERALGEADRAPANGVWTLSSGTGGGGPLDVAPEDDFLRLDLDLRWTIEPTVGGRSTRLRPYLRVMNALDSRDALFQYLDRWREGEIRPVAERPFLPIIGVEWRF